MQVSKIYITKASFEHKKGANIIDAEQNLSSLIELMEINVLVFL